VVHGVEVACGFLITSLLLAATVVSCSGAEPKASSPRTSTTTRTSVEPRAQADVAATTAHLEEGEPCDGSDFELSGAQFAFVGTVTRVQPGPSPSVRWVTFAVEGWYTDDWGAHIKIYMPGFAVAPGDHLAVAGDAKQASIYGFTGQSGTAEACMAIDGSPGDHLATWEAQFGSLIEPGRDRTNVAGGGTRLLFLPALKVGQIRHTLLLQPSASHRHQRRAGRCFTPRSQVVSMLSCRTRRPDT
jgi:hypothetical protein